MRYLVITYYNKPDGTADESTVVRNSLRPRDYTQANVILDYRDQKVLKARVNGAVFDQGFDHISNYYEQYYGDLIRELKRQSGPVGD